LNYKAIDLTGSGTSLSGALPIANGGSGQTTKGPAFDALSPMTTNGDLITRAVGVNSRLAIGTSGQVLTVVGGLPSWATPSSSVLQIVSVSNVAFSSSAATTPFDDTIPQSSEGVQVLTVNITPSNNTSKLVVQGVIMASCPSADSLITSLFSGGVNAIYANMIAVGAGQLETIDVLHKFTPGSTSTLTMSIRVGCVVGAGINFNGDGGGRKFGGVSTCWMVITEYA